MMVSLIVAALVLTLGSGVPGIFMKGGRAASQRIATVLHLVGCAAGLAAALLTFAGGSSEVRFSWPVPDGILAIRLDSISAFFLVPLFLVTGAGTLYGEGYWPETANPAHGRKLRFFYGMLTAGFALVTIAADAWLFLIGWEIVGLSAFFLVTTESGNREALRAGWIYLIATHVSTLVLFAMFGALRAATGSWLLHVSVLGNSAMVTPIFILALIGFGIKAGFMPFHVWLPEAHAAAPSHVSAILSGVVLKIGIYGLVRVMTIVPPKEWLGLALLFAGIASGVLGVVFALAQHDLKRLLAYHSIENIGIILIGLGAGVLGRQEMWGAFAMAGALLHVWNHAFFKALLFLAAGSVVHATGTRSIDELGGLMRRLPTTGIAFLVGAVAICGLPPLNGFVSEWLIYLAAFKNATSTVIAGGSALLAAPALALIGGLAVACFVKAFSVAFLGVPRSARAQNAHSEALSMRIAMAVLGVVCAGIGLWPLAVYGPLAQVTAGAIGHHLAGAEIHGVFSELPVASFLVLAAITGTTIAVAAKTRNASQTVTWDCGYVAPNERMQYTASSFAGPLVGLFRWALRPDTHQPDQKSLFPAGESFASHVPDPVLDRFLVPAISRLQRFLGYARFIQAGRIQVYILYIVATLLILIAWSAS